MTEPNPKSPPDIDEQPETSDAPGAPKLPDDVGVARGGTRDVSDRPQADPEVPELGADDKARGLPGKDATGF
jgi:hypothetical protein